jgi:hypothetical protein
MCVIKELIEERYQRGRSTFGKPMALEAAFGAKATGYDSSSVCDQRGAQRVIKEFIKEHALKTLCLSSQGLSTAIAVSPPYSDGL